MVLIEALAWLAAGPPAFALLIYSLEIAAGLAGAHGGTTPAAAAGSVAILIPAHNEAAGIAATVAGLKSVAPQNTRFLVIADNCDDDTASLARAAGAEVAERFDSERRGKGYALAFGRDILAGDPPAVVIVVDADCELIPGSIEHLCAGAERGVAAQATYLFYPDRSAPALVQISNFAFLVKNLVRSRGLGRIGRCALLTGSGMAFPWPLFAHVPLASGDITEDLELGIRLVRRGIGVQLVEQATVLSRAATLGDNTTQRRRWEHGFLANALRHALPTLAAGLTHGSRSMIALGLHLLVPPLALLFLIAGAALAVLVGIGALWAIWSPVALLAVTMAAALALTAIAWLRYGRETLAFTALLQAPLYVAWKIPNYLRFLYKRETRWERTRREGDV